MALAVAVVEVLVVAADPVPVVVVALMVVPAALSMSRLPARPSMAAISTSRNRPPLHCTRPPPPLLLPPPPPHHHHSLLPSTTTSKPRRSSASRNTLQTLLAHRNNRKNLSLLSPRRHHPRGPNHTRSLLPPLRPLSSPAHQRRPPRKLQSTPVAAYLCKALRTASQTQTAQHLEPIRLSSPTLHWQRRRPDLGDL